MRSPGALTQHPSSDHRRNLDVWPVMTQHGNCKGCLQGQRRAFGGTTHSMVPEIGTYGTGWPRQHRHWPACMGQPVT